METHLDEVHGHMREVASHGAIKDRRFLDDEQLLKAEQLELLDAVFNAKVRNREIMDLASHFAEMFRGGHPMHVLIWGKTGTGKTLTVLYFLKMLAKLCKRDKIPLRYEHLDLSTPRHCFRALNDLACQMRASRRYRHGISMEEMMHRIETVLADYKGHFVLFVDEADHVRRDADTFYTFLIRRLPQAIRAKLTLILTSNKINWAAELDARVHSFFRCSEMLFHPYNAEDLQHILKIRVDRALHPQATADGVIEKIAAMACREHGDARKAVTLLAGTALLAERRGTNVNIEVVDEAANELEEDRYILTIRTAPVHLQAVMAAMIESWRSKGLALSTGDAFHAYQQFCTRVELKALARRAFGDLVSELGIYSLIRVRVLSRGRYGRSRDIVLDLPRELEDRIYDTILLNFGLKQGHA